VIGKTLVVIGWFLIAISVIALGAWTPMCFLGGASLNDSAGNITAVCAGPSGVGIVFGILALVVGRRVRQRSIVGEGD
jgi:hypothetical protein